jgi:hypothetical protein
MQGAFAAGWSSSGSLRKKRQRHGQRLPRSRSARYERIPPSAPATLPSHPQDALRTEFAKRQKNLRGGAKSRLTSSAEIGINTLMVNGGKAAGFEATGIRPGFAARIVTASRLGSYARNSGSLPACDFEVARCISGRSSALMSVRAGALHAAAGLPLAICGIRHGLNQPRHHTGR